MYNDFRSPRREEWRYTYFGKELLEAARAKLTEFTDKETTCRQEMAGLMTDATVSMADDGVDKLKKDIERFASLAEQCSVFVHQFARAPDEKFSLGLGDVVFFGLQKGT